jgi:hypothetical protein
LGLVKVEAEITADVAMGRSTTGSRSIDPRLLLLLLLLWLLVGLIAPATALSVEGLNRGGHALSEGLTASLQLLLLVLL